MSPEKKIAFGALILVVLVLAILVISRLPKRMKQENFKTKWKALQERCPDKEQWATAIIEADNLLDEALKKKRIKGKTMGERMVSAQNMFSDNDIVWYGHKLRKKIDVTPDLELHKHDVQKALFGLRSGLKDIGAL